MNWDVNASQNKRYPKHIDATVAYADALEFSAKLVSFL